MNVDWSPQRLLAHREQGARSLSQLYGQKSDAPKNAWSDNLIGHPINKARFYLTDQNGAAVDTNSD